MMPTTARAHLANSCAVHWQNPEGHDSFLVLTICDALLLSGYVRIIADQQDEVSKQQNKPQAGFTAFVRLRNTKLQLLEA